MTNSLIPGPAGALPVGPELAEALERQVLAPARSIGADLPLIAVTDPPPPIEVQRSPHGTWWLAATHDADPIALSNGGMTEAPRPVVEELRALRAAGIDFQFIHVLHELPGSWQPGTPPPTMKLAGSADEELASVVRTQEAVFATGFKALRAAAGAVGMAALGVSATGAAIAAAVAFDPVVLGGVQDPESERIAWFPLAAWDEVPR